ncbi:MAG: hypothetical protein P3W94_009875 [Paracoccus sp. (in: a-proteobacteria)]|nr:hypothetical protein [Paracoccus sp. (in: a-proteobacteria)]
MTYLTDTDPRLDSDLMAYIDGTLPPEKLSVIEARLARDAQAREAVAQWRHFDNLLRDYAAQADMQPTNIKIAALERELARKLKKRQRRVLWLGQGVRRLVASVAIFVAGWGGHAYYSATIAANAFAHPSFMAPTLAGHQTYLYATTGAVEYGGDEIEAALDWMSKQMQRKIDSPKLERLGYQVQSARLIVVDEQPLALFYYRNPDNETVTVSMTPRHLTQPHYAFRVADIANHKTAYWSSNGLNYAVVSDDASVPLSTLAAAVQD